MSETYMEQLYIAYEGDHMADEATMDQPFGPGFTDEQTAEADRLEIWTGVCENGNDQVTFKLLNKGEVVHERAIQWVEDHMW